MKRAYIQTFGCQMNEHDSDRMTELLKRSGYELSDTPEDSEVIIINTCSVRENPENKVYSQLGRIRELKKKNRDLIIGVGGCVAQQEGEKILKREKAVDIVFGTDGLFSLPKMIESARQGNRILHLDWLPREKKVQNFIPEEDLETGRVDGCKAYVSITKGCDNFCSFCVVPFTRGREVSREPENILREAENLISRGAKEIMLLGQNVNSYRVRDYGFYELLRDVSDLEGLERLRFVSPHPKDWNNELSELTASRKTICNQLHLPFQAGSSRVVKLMRRDHTIENYLEKVRYLQSLIPQVGLSTDIIVGFPTETAEDFEKTLEVLEEVRFHQVFAFKYSPRPFTRAAKMEDDVPREVKEERLDRLQKLQRKIMKSVLAEYKGNTEEVLVESASIRTRGAMSGKTDSNIPVCINDSDAEIGSVVKVKITDYKITSLIGEPVNEYILN